MKTLLKVVLGLFGLIALGLVAVFFFTTDMVTTADDFFAAVKNQNMNKAYTYLSEDFKASTSKSDLQQYLNKNAISSFKEASWESRSINGGRGSLTGSISTESGGVVPITLNFVEAENGWKIYSILKPSSGIHEETISAQMPSEQEQISLVKKSIQVFAEDVNRKSMKKFHAYISNLWQRQVTVAKLDEAFGAFYNIGADMTVLANYSPQFSQKPSINEDGVLVIAGKYPTKPSQVDFEQKYIYEGLGWKLMGFNINIK
ncbi:MAG: hypothetical protein OQJ95_09885 [Kangiella sp.]|nr:hypothetical protein [Kangiella sp.]